MILILETPIKVIMKHDCSFQTLSLISPQTLDFGVHVVGVRGS